MHSLLSSKIVRFLQGIQALNYSIAPSVFSSPTFQFNCGIVCINDCKLLFS